MMFLLGIREKSRIPSVTNRMAFYFCTVWPFFVHELKMGYYPYDLQYYAPMILRNRPVSTHYKQGI